MRVRNSFRPWIILIFVLAVFAAIAFAAGKDKDRDKDKPKSSSESGKPSYELPQPAKENLDLTAYQRIREEGLRHSHVMEFASALMDGIGSRLTGSPNLKRANEWTRDQLAAMGCTNVHLEDWGEFGMGWQQMNTWLRMASPDTAVFIAQAVPWSPSTNGAVSAPAIWIDIKNEEDLAKYKGKLAGKIVLYGEMREVKPVEKPLFVREDEKSLAKMAEYPLVEEDEYAQYKKDYARRAELQAKLMPFLAEEKALAVITPSRDGHEGGGSGGTIFDDRGIGRETYKREHAMQVPVVVAAIESYGRVYRLLKANVPVTLELNVDTKFFGDHEHGFNTIAEIEGTDPKLKDEVVMVGGHLDSWIAGTGATDNGAGTVVAMEVMRIFKALGIRPRRTIRVGLWTGEEQGEYGSAGYVKGHFGYVPLSAAPDQMRLPSWMRKASGPPILKPDQAEISAYFNLDSGSGKIDGVYLQENAAIEPIFEQWIEPLKDLGVTTITMRGTSATDHESFDAVGIPGFQFIQDPLDYFTRTHHSNEDVYERLQAADLAQAATVEAIFVYNAAMRDQMLPRKPLPHPELEGQRSAPLKGVMPGAQAPAKEEGSKE